MLDDFDKWWQALPPAVQSSIVTAVAVVGTGVITVAVTLLNTWRLNKASDKRLTSQLQASRGDLVLKLESDSKQAREAHLVTMRKEVYLEAVAAKPGFIKDLLALPHLEAGRNFMAQKGVLKFQAAIEKVILVGNDETSRLARAQLERIQLMLLELMQAAQPVSVKRSVLPVLQSNLDRASEQHKLAEEEVNRFVCTGTLNEQEGARLCEARDYRKKLLDAATDQRAALLSEITRLHKVYTEMALPLIEPLESGPLDLWIAIRSELGITTDRNEAQAQVQAQFEQRKLAVNRVPSESERD